MHNTIIYVPEVLSSLSLWRISIERIRKKLFGLGIRFSSAVGVGLWSVLVGCVGWVMSSPVAMEPVRMRNFTSTLVCIRMLSPVSSKYGGFSGSVLFGSRV